MFGWFYDFLYSITKTLLRLIDGLIVCANMLCGIEPINFDGEQTDFLSYLLFSEEIGFAFRISAVLATVLLVIFTVFMIIRSIVKEKAEGTPAQIAVKSFKTLLTFFLVPLVVFAFIVLGNTFMQALYSATIQGAASPGAFLFSSFAVDGGMDPGIARQFSEGLLDYTNTDVVEQYMDISDFPFFFSWLTAGVVLFGIGSSMLIFVDRVLSLVILYIAAPLSLSTSVLDDGARFKLWRDQFLTKFITGYGMILAINIYAMVCGLVMNPDLIFFADSDFLNFIMKLLIIGGGAFTMQKSMALIGNLVSQGAGSNELRDNAFTAGRLAGIAKSAFGLPFRPVGSIVSDALAMKSRDFGSRLLNKLGMGISGQTSDEKGVKDPDGKSDSQNNDKADYSKDKDKAKDAISGGGFNLSFPTGNDENKNDKKSDNDNNNKPNDNKDNPVSNIINNGSGNENKNENKGEGGDK